MTKDSWQKLNKHKLVLITIHTLCITVLGSAVMAEGNKWFELTLLVGSAVTGKLLLELEKYTQAEKFS